MLAGNECYSFSGRANGESLCSVSGHEGGTARVGLVKSVCIPGTKVVVWRQRC